uniref:PAK4-inhibitor INKA2 n=1 Tax=Mola mola TaxID=94237 RepID=A0A3Q3VXQ9_MOLML
MWNKVNGLDAKRKEDIESRRLKEDGEPVSMKEAGDGLHAQMNSMMGALQELKLLQVQTALENLDISGRPINRGVPHPNDRSERSARSRQSEYDLESIPRRWSGYAAPQVDFYGPMVGNPPPKPDPHPQAPRHTQVVDLPGILYSLSREGPSLDSNYSQESADDGSDWTSSLMSRTRNRQPLVLGDNVFADLVGNWLDLPEVEREEDRPDTPAHPLHLSRSQEICRKFSLTTNIFKKFLRSVRPDRDKLLKERPGWMAPELSEGDLFKRPKKLVPKCSKGTFYLPFWVNAQQGKGRLCPHAAEAERNHQHYFPQVHQQPFTGIYLDRRQPESGHEKMQPLFDYNTAVWV